MGPVRGDRVSSWSVKCEVGVLEAKNVELNHPSELFVRCYLSAGVPINTKEISYKSEKLLWGELFSLECSGDHNLIETLMGERVVFELRRRRTIKSVFKKFSRSKLIGRVEAPWKTVLGSAGMEMEQWLSLVVEGVAVDEGLKTPMIRVRMSVQVATMMERRKERPEKWDECGCKYGDCCCVNDDLFLVLGASMFEGL